jgi:hypothetical protein
MSTIHLLGKIVPSSAYKVTMWDLATVHYKSIENKLEVDISIQVKDSTVDIECVCNRVDQEALSHIHKIAYDLARAAVNLMSFATGITFFVVIDQIVDANGVTNPFAVQAPSLAAFCTAYGTTTAEGKIALGDIMKVVFAEPGVFLALDDLITATSLHHLVTINTARAIEGLRHAMAPEDISRNQAWELFRTNLNLDEKYLRLITDNSQSGRHGEGKHVPGPVTSEIIERAWKIMNRFLEFRKSGNQRLPLADFPLLAG